MFTSDTFLFIAAQAHTHFLRECDTYEHGKAVTCTAGSAMWQRTEAKENLFHLDNYGDGMC